MDSDFKTRTLVQFLSPIDIFKSANHVFLSTQKDTTKWSDSSVALPHLLPCLDCLQPLLQPFKLAIGLVCVCVCVCVALKVITERLAEITYNMFVALPEDNWRGGKHGVTWTKQIICVAFQIKADIEVHRGYVQNLWTIQQIVHVSGKRCYWSPLSPDISLLCVCELWRSVAAFSTSRTKHVALCTQSCRFPPEKVNLAEYIGDRKVVLLGLPGAFTPTWSGGD